LSVVSELNDDWARNIKNGIKKCPYRPLLQKIFLKVSEKPHVREDI
jgi:hypothetical protein